MPPVIRDRREQDAAVADRDLHLALRAFGNMRVEYPDTTFEEILAQIHRRRGLMTNGQDAVR